MSHATLLSGLYPPRHGVRDNGTFALAAAIETLPEALRASGYDTAAVVSAVVLERRHHLDQGFRVYDDDLGAGYAAGTEVGERQADATTAAALAALAGLRAPFFLWVHYFDPHEEYRPPTPWAAVRLHNAGDWQFLGADNECSYFRTWPRVRAAAPSLCLADYEGSLGQ